MLMYVNLFPSPHPGTRDTSEGFTPIKKEMIMAQKGAGGNQGAVTKKGGDNASGSTGSGRGGGNGGGGQTGKK